MHEKIKSLGLGLESMEDLERRANDLFIQADHHLLLDIWADLTAEQRQHLPNFALNIAKILISMNRIVEARQCLDISYEAWKHDPNSVARVFIQHALIYRYNNDIPGMEHAIKVVLEKAVAIPLIAEAYNMMGELKMVTAPVESLPFFEKAIAQFSLLRPVDPLVGYDLARVHRRAAQTAFARGLHDVGLRHQRWAIENLQGLSQATLLIGWDLIMAGQMQMAIGRHEEAWELFNQANHFMSDDLIFPAQLHCYKASLAMMHYDDQTATSELAQIDINRLDSAVLIIHVLMTQGHLALYQDRLEAVENYLKEAQHFAADTPLMQHEVFLLNAALRLRQQQVDADLLAGLEATIQYFTDNEQMTLLSQAYLLYAWASAVHGLSAQTIHEALVQCIRSAERMKNIWHLYRLYELSHPDLATYWPIADQKLDFWQRHVQSIEKAIITRPSGNGLRVFAFGQPSVRNGQHFMTTSASRNIKLTLLLYMLQVKRASLEQVISAIWYDEPFDKPKMRNRLHNTISRLKDELGVKCIEYNHLYERYELVESAIRYYDVAEFSRLCMEIQQGASGQHRLVQCQRAIATYTGEFASGIAAPCFEDDQRAYQQQYVRLLKTAIQQALDLERHDLAESWRVKLQQAEIVGDEEMG